MRKLVVRFPTRSNTNLAVLPQMMARGFNVQISKVEGLYYLCSGNKGQISCALTAQLVCTFVFTYAKNRFSHGAAQTNLPLLSSFFEQIGLGYLWTFPNRTSQAKMQT